MALTSNSSWVKKIIDTRIDLGYKYVTMNMNIALLERERLS
jgi:hypothetical protein